MAPYDVHVAPMMQVWGRLSWCRWRRWEVIISIFDHFEKIEFEIFLILEFVNFTEIDVIFSFDIVCILGYGSIRIYHRDEICLGIVAIGTWIFKMLTWSSIKKPIEGFVANMGVEPKIVGKTPKWMVKMVETLLKWMIWGAHPYFWKHPYVQMGFVSTNMVTSVVQHVRWKEQLIIHTKTNTS